MSAAAPAKPGLAGLLTLLLVAFMMGANHVAARVAFNHGVDVVTAVCVRSGVTALVLWVILRQAQVRLAASPRQRRFLILMGVLIALQSYCLYSSVSRLPVALALLVFNTYPISTAICARLLYGHRTERTVLLAMPVMLIGLALALDVSGATSGLGVSGQWQQMGAGVLYALGASFSFGLVLVWTQHEAAALDGRFRSFTTMAQVGVITALAALLGDGFHLPQAAAGWWGLGLLTFLYGTAFTILFVVLPRMGVVGSSPIMNVEPVFALILAWALLGQAIAPLQLVGAALVVGTVTVLGLRRR